MDTASIRARVPERAKVVKRRAVRIAKTVADKVVLDGVARPWLSLGRAGRTPNRSQPHYLMVRYGNYGPDPSHGESSEAFMLERPFAATGRGTCEQFFWDRDFHGFPRGDWALLERCSRARPDAILLSLYRSNRSRAGAHRNDSHPPQGMEYPNRRLLVGHMLGRFLVFD